jgi:ABC-type transport system involved in multi-copper enzyme maturation permease subunit
LIRRISTIAVHTFKEAARERVLYNLIVFALLMIGASILMSHISVGIQGIVVINLGLSSISLFGLLMAIFIGIGLVYKEIDRRSIYSILAKPVPRWEFVIGKYAGLCMTILINTSIMTLGFYLALFYQQPIFNRAALYPLGAIYFILLELALVVGIAIFFSSITTPVLSAVFTFCVYVIGHFLSEIKFLGQASQNSLVEKITAFIYYALPNFNNFDVIAQTAHAKGIAPTLLIANSLYALLYVSVLLSSAILIFEGKEFR